MRKFTPEEARKEIIRRGYGEGQESLQGLPYLKKEGKKLASSVSNAISNIPDLIAASAQAPKQTAAGIVPGITSLADLFYAVPYNLGAYLGELGQGYNYGEENIEPTPRIPYYGHELGSNLVNNFVSAPKTEEEQQARMGGELLSILTNPAKIGSQLTSKTARGAQIVGSKTAGKLADFIPGRKNKRELGQINELLEEVSPSYAGDVSGDIRKASKNIIRGEERSLQEKAKPHYEKASSERISREGLQQLFHDYPVIEDAFRKVTKDSAFAPQVRKYGVSSIHTLDLVKKELDKEIKNLAKGSNPEQHAYKASVIGEAKDKLLEKLDELSPEYNKARGIYAEEAPKVKELKESPLGRISRFKDKDLKRIGSTIFDKLETNPQRFKEVKDRIYKENPDAWKAITRQEIERKIDSPSEGLNHFFNKVLKDEKNFRMLEDSLFYNPKAQEQLRNLRDIFTPRGNLSESIKAILPNWSKKIGGDRLAEIILEPKYSSEIKKIKDSPLEKQPFLVDRFLNVLSQTSVNTRQPELEPEFTQEEAVKELERRFKEGQIK